MGREVICSFSTVSTSHAEFAYRDYPRRRFGLIRDFRCDQDYGRLAQGEDLFLLGHCRDGRFGPPTGHPGFSPDELADWLMDSVLPPNYLGDIYVGTNIVAQGYVVALGTFLELMGNNRLFHGSFPTVGSNGPVHFLGAGSWVAVPV